MKLINFIIIFLTIIFLTSCIKEQKNKLAIDCYSKGYQFINKIKNFEKENELYLASYGIDLDSKNDPQAKSSIHRFEIFYDSLEKLNINNARKKLIKCVEEYLNEINNDQELKQYLYNHPFTDKELVFCIFFYEQTGGSLKDPYISLCSVDQGMVYYNVDYSDGSFERFHEEPYEKAVEIAHNNLTPEIPKKNKSRRIYIPSFDEAEEICPGINKITPRVEEKTN